MLSGDQTEALVNLSRALGAVSTFCCLVVFISFFVVQGARSKWAFQLVMGLMFNDFGRSITDAVGNPEDGTSYCKLQAWFRAFFQLSSALSTTAIAFTMYKQFVKTDINYSQLSGTILNQRWKYCAAIWGFPLVWAFFTSIYKFIWQHWSVLLDCVRRLWMGIRMASHSVLWSSLDLRGVGGLLVLAVVSS